MAKRMNDEKFETFMEDLTARLESRGVPVDRSDDVIDMSEDFSVYVNLLTPTQYRAMQRDISRFSISGKGFKVYAWNDSSSYEYWRAEGESGSSNYIRVTASITQSTAHSLDYEALEDAMMDAKSHFQHYDNADEYYALQDEKESVEKQSSTTTDKKDAPIIVLS